MRRPRVVAASRQRRAQRTRPRCSWRQVRGRRAVRSIELQRRVGRGHWRRVGRRLGGAAADVAVKRGQPVRFRVRAVDREGPARRHGPTARSARWPSAWRAGASSCTRAHRQTRRARAGACQAALPRPCRSPSWPGPDRAWAGRASLLDGKRVASVDLSAGRRPPDAPRLGAQLPRARARRTDQRRLGRRTGPSSSGFLVLR